MSDLEGSVRPASLYYKFDLDSKLQDINPGYTAGVSEKQASEIKSTLDTKLSKLQELLYVSGKHSVLVLLQGLDSAGKDGAVSSILPSLRASSVSVTGFKQPSPDELAHDFLWRYHQRTPAIGNIGIFNRSYYEAVLADKFQRLVPEDKAFLHISKDEQKKRLMKREVERSWKVTATDWPSHDRFEEYIDIHNSAFKACSAATPWYVIPSNEKWFRDIALAQLLVDCLKPYASVWKVDRALLSNPQTRPPNDANRNTSAKQRAADLTTIEIKAPPSSKL